ncbi:MAG TPA: DUF3108 domain-containing protein [Bacteroidia bacterium]|nr:DUF3108 domain-containing protein [Bacteroidia bacterium]
MKRILSYFLLLGLVPQGGYAQSTGTGSTSTGTNDYRKVTNKAFKRGEELHYRVHYGAINAGVADMTVESDNKLINNRPTFHMVGVGSSKGAFDWVFKVRDRYETYMDEEALMPWLFIRRVDEGGFKINQNQSFDHNGGKVVSNGKSLTVPKYIQDMLSSFYYARTMDFSKAKVNDIFSVPTFVDDEIWDLKIKFLGREAIDTDVGKVNCLKFCPVVQKGRVFKKEEDLTVYISDDDNHIPVRAQGEILVGSVKLDLMSYSGLAANLNMAK